MIAAAAAQRGYENSKRRSRAAWTEARRRARQRAEEREKAARERADARRQWFHQARRNPRHPVAWGYGLAWGLAATGGAAVAGARGARDGAREGANVGRRAAREGWGLGTAWTEYRRQRSADQEQAKRGEGEPAQAGASADGSEPGPPPVWVTCRGCGTAITQHRARAAGGLCPACLDPTPPRPGAAGDAGQGPEPDRDSAIEDAVVVEDLPACPRCGRPVEGELHPADGGGICADCRQEVSQPEHDNSDDSSTSTDQHTETEDPVSTPQTQMSLNGASLSGGDGEGYAGTVAALEQMAHLLEQVQQVSNDLGDQVTAKNVDAETISGLSRLSDHIEAAAGEAGSTLAHVQSKHNEVAAAVSGAGGSTEVADTDWYDQY